MTQYLHRGRFPLPVDLAVVAAAWRERGFGCDPFTDPPGRVWRDFVHATNELVTVIEGRLTLTIGETAVTAEPGDEVFIPCGMTHTVRNVHPGTTRWLFGYDGSPG